MNDLLVSLRSDPTPEERALAEGVGLSDGQAVPFRMFARVALRQHRDSEAIGEMEAMRNWFRRRLRAALVALAVNAVGIGGYTAHRIAASAVAEEHEREQDRNQDRMEQQIIQLRKYCGLDPQGMSIVRLDPSKP